MTAKEDRDDVASGVIEKVHIDYTLLYTLLYTVFKRPHPVEGLPRARARVCVCLCVPFARFYFFFLFFFFFSRRLSESMWALQMVLQAERKYRWSLADTAVLIFFFP